MIRISKNFAYAVHYAKLVTNIIGEYIQIDATINQGNAGGPLCEMKGKVIGVTMDSPSLTGENIGIGFAVPSKIAKKVMQQILHYDV